MNTGETSSKGSRSSSSDPFAASSAHAASFVSGAASAAADLPSERKERNASPSGYAPAFSGVDASGAAATTPLFSFGSKITRRPISEYRLGEEIASSVSHGVGALLSIAALVLCIVFAARSGSASSLVAAIVYGVSMLLEYVASTLYHALTNPKAKRVFKVLDHSGIYLFIAGSYTPFCLLPLANVGGLYLCTFVWAVALIGIALEAFWTYRPRWVSVVIYLALGWAVVAFFPALVATLDPMCINLLVLGGVCYSIGCVFYVFKKVPYFHFVFHLLVLAGSAFHFFAILLYVL